MCRVFWLVLIFVFAGLILHVLYCFGLIISFYFLHFQGLTDRRCIAFCEFSFYSRRNQVHWFCLLNLWTILCLQIWWQFTLILLSHNPFITDTHQRGQIFFETKKKNLNLFDVTFLQQKLALIMSQICLNSQFIFRNLF